MVQFSRNKALQYRSLMNQASDSLTDQELAHTPMLTEAWKPGVEYKEDKRLQYGEKLYKVRQKHTSQADWTPDITPALYTEVPVEGQGDTPDNPIPYSGNMELVKDKYYSQYDVVYICTRDTGIPVYDNLADLVGLYVEVWVG